MGFLAATASATPAQVVPAPAVTSSGSSIATIVTQLCGSSPNYCTWKSGANKDGALQAFLTEALTTRLIPYPGTSQNAQMVMEADARTDCSSYATSPGSSAVQKVATVAKTAGTATAGIAVAAGAAAGSVVPVIGTIIGVIAGLVSSLFGANHAKAVAGEQGDICSAVPAINGVLQQIDAGLAAGSISPSDAQTAYSALQSQFSAALKKNTTFKTGDALWAFNLALTGVLQVRAQDLKNGVLTSGAPGPWTAAGAAAASPLGSIAAALGLSPSETPWLVLGGAAALAFLL